MCPALSADWSSQPDVQGVVVAKSAGIRVGLHDQGGTDIGKRNADVNLKGVGQDRAERDENGRQSQGVQEAGFSSTTRSPCDWLGVRRPRYDGARTSMTSGRVPCVRMNRFPGLAVVAQGV